MKYKLEVVCGNGHTTTLSFQGRCFSKQFLKQLAGLYDGTSPMYIKAPDEQSMLGRCCLCGANLKCTVHNVPLETIPCASGPSYLLPTKD